MKTNYFKATTLEDLKKEYKQLAKKFHPDMNKDKDTTSIFVAVRDQYEKIFAQLLKSDKKSYQHKEAANDTAFRDAIDALIKYADINIEIVGSWVWVSGNTFGIKDELKNLGFKWSKSNKKWYLGEISGPKKKRAMAWDKKVELYGCDTVQTAQAKEKVLIPTKG